MKIAVIGTGYVGLVTSACFAKLGHTVIGADNDPSKIEKLNKLQMPIYEPGLEELVKENVKHGRISFTSNVSEAVKKSSIIFICVGTPPLSDGGADLSAVEKVARLIAEEMTDYKLVIDKSRFLSIPVHG